MSASASDTNTSASSIIDSGLWSILSMAALHSIAADQAKLVHEFGAPFDTQKILLAAQSLGMSAKAITQDPARLAKAPLPAVAQMRDGTFFLLAKII